MPVPSLITDLTTVAATNSPLGSESPATADDYFRAHASFIAQLRAVIGGATDANIPSSELGVGQAWQNVLGSRASGVSYTNSTGKPIQVSVSTLANSSNSLNLTISGVSAGNCIYNGSGGQSFVTGIIPNGATYSVTAVGGIAAWAELR